MSNKELHIFTDTHDWVVAFDRHDAIKVWNEYVGDDYIENEYGDVDDWEQWDDEKPLGIITEDISNEPEYVTIKKLDEYRWRVFATGKQWIECYGRGYLCGEDF